MRQLIFVTAISATLFALACADNAADGDACGSAANALSQCSGTQTSSGGSVTITFDSNKFATQCAASAAGLEVADCVNSHLGDCGEIMKCLGAGISKDAGKNVVNEEEDAGKKDASTKFPTLDGGSKTDASISNDGGTVDGSVLVDSGIKPDAKPPVTCQPGSTAGFTGGTYVPVAPGSKCTATQITAYQNCLLDPVTNAADCDKVAGANGDDPCIQCIYTPEAAAAWGALVEVNGGARYNVMGCVEKVVGSTPGKTCAKAYVDLSACVQYACDANCTTATDTELEACYVAAQSGACAAYDTAYATCETNNAKIGTTCYRQPSESDIARQVRFAKLFCGK